MQGMLAAAGVTVAASALISLATLAPPLTVVPPLPVAADPIDKTIDIAPISIMTPEDESPLAPRMRGMPVIDTPAMFDDMTGEMLIIPPIGDLPAAEPPFAQVSPRDLKHDDEKKSANKKEPRSGDVCTKYGKHKSWYTQDQHRYWHCV